MKADVLLLGAALCLFTISCGGTASADPPGYDHIVIAIEENKSAAQVESAPYLASLKAGGAFMARSYGIAHPSQPNYIALFSGSLNGVTDDNQHDITAPNLATSLLDAGRGFATYSEDLPPASPRVFTSGRYARKHNPCASFTNAPDSVNLPFTSFPADFAQLPAVSFVIPNLDDDMHDGSVAQGDAWLQAKLGSYAQWALTHDSLLVVTFDECDGSAPVATTPLFTVLYGAHVQHTVSSLPITHYSLLRLIEDIDRLPPLGEAARAQRIEGIWD